MCSSRNRRTAPLLLIAALLWTAGGTARSVRGTTNALTLATALQLADEHNLSLRAVREEAAIARGRARVTCSSAHPQIGLGAELTRLDDVITFGEFTMGQEDNYAATAEVSQALYAGGRIYAGLRLARKYAEAAEAQIVDAGQETAYAVHALFNHVLLAKETLQVAARAVELAQRNHADVSARLEQGMAKRFDLLRANEQVSHAQADRIAAENGALKARLALFRALELPLDDPREIAGSLDSATSPVDDRHVVQAALKRRPDIAVAETAIAMQREALEMARGERRPTVALFGQLKYANPDRSFADDWEASWLVGARAELPLFDGLAARGKIQQEAAQLRRVEFQRDDAVSRARLEIAEAQADLATAAKLVEARNRSVTQAQEALRLAQRAYAEGVERQIDVISAQTALTESRYQLAAARFESIMACRRFQLATGSIGSTVGGLEQTHPANPDNPQENDGQ